MATSKDDEDDDGDVGIGIGAWRTLTFPGELLVVVGGSEEGLNCKGICVVFFE